MDHHLQKFLDAHHKHYKTALLEIANGAKRTHWMWFIFPQLKGLGHSDTANYYAIKNVKEAVDFLQHPILGKHLEEISNALLLHNDKTASQIFGSPDDKKLHSSITLFAAVSHSGNVFREVLDTYFHGSGDELTLKLLC